VQLSFASLKTVPHAQEWRGGAVSAEADAQLIGGAILFQALFQCLYFCLRCEREGTFGPSCTRPFARRIARILRPTRTQMAQGVARAEISCHTPVIPASSAMTVTMEVYMGDFIQGLIGKGLAGLSQHLFQALAALIPLASGALLKMLQGHSHERRSTELTQRISSLTKTIHDLPQLSLPGTALGVTPQAALTAELQSAIHELTVLQNSPSRGFAFSTFTAKIRSALLLYQPKGLAAWTLHIVFYAYLICFVVIMWAGFLPDNTSDLGPASQHESFAFKLFLFIFVFGVLGVPPLIIRYFAARIHEKQRPKKQDAAQPLPSAESKSTPEAQHAFGQQA
jgi:hypothetical protein